MLKEKKEMSYLYWSFKGMKINMKKLKIRC